MHEEALRDMPGFTLYLQWDLSQNQPKAISLVMHEMQIQKLWDHSDMSSHEYHAKVKYSAFRKFLHDPHHTFLQAEEANFKKKAKHSQRLTTMHNVAHHFHSPTDVLKTRPMATETATRGFSPTASPDPAGKAPQHKSFEPFLDEALLDEVPFPFSKQKLLYSHKNQSPAQARSAFYAEPSEGAHSGHRREHNKENQVDEPNLRLPMAHESPVANETHPKSLAFPGWMTADHTTRSEEDFSKALRKVIKKHDQIATLKRKGDLNDLENKKLRSEPEVLDSLKELAAKARPSMSEHQGALRKLLKELNQIQAMKQQKGLSAEEKQKVQSEPEVLQEIKDIFAKIRPICTRISIGPYGSLSLYISLHALLSAVFDEAHVN